MNMLESILVSLESLLSNKLRSFLTMIGIVVGVAAVVTVVSIGQSGKMSIVSSISKYGDGFFTIMPKNVSSGSAQSLLSYQDLAELRKLEGVSQVAGVVTRTMETKSGGETVSFVITGTNSELPKMENMKLAAGRFFHDAEERSRLKVMVVEERFAAKTYGSTEQALDRKVVLNNSYYQIVGVYRPDKSIFDFEDNTQFKAYVPILSLPDAAATPNPELSMVYIKSAAVDSAKVNHLAEKAKKLLAARHYLKTTDYASQSAKDAQQSVSTVFGVMQLIIGSIAGISLFVGGVGVMNIMLVSVTERTREIGIRKAIGATPSTILWQFLVEAVVLCFLGGIVGAVLGLGFSYLFSFITKWPFIISGWAIVASFTFSAAVGLFFGLYPARKAARMQPIEALRYE